MIEERDLTLLIVEDDPHYARAIADLARDQDFKVLIARRGDEALSLALAYKPTAISLDVLPARYAWLEHSQSTEAEPGNAPYSGADVDPGGRPPAGAWLMALFPFSQSRPKTRSLKSALGRIKSFTQPRRKTLAIIEDNEAERLSISALLEHDGVDIVSFTSGHDAVQYLSANPCDCMVLDLKLPDMTGFEILERMGRDERHERHPGHRFYGAGTVGRGGRSASRHGSQRRRKGRRVAGAAAR